MVVVGEREREGEGEREREISTGREQPLIPGTVAFTAGLARTRHETDGAAPDWIK